MTMKQHHISSFFSTSTMVLFHRHDCWLLYFEVFLLFLLFDDFNQSLGSLITLDITLMSNQITAIYHDYFLRALWRHFTVMIVDCYILKFFCHSSSKVSATTCPYFCLHWKYFSERSYYHHISSLFLSQNNGVFSPSPLLIVMFWSFSMIPPHVWLHPLVGMTDSIGSNFMSDHIISILILWSLILFELLCWAI